MADFELKPWEHEPLWLKVLTPYLRRKRFPSLTENPQKGKWYRIYPEGCIDACGEKTYADFQIGAENKLLVFFCGGGVSWNEYTAARPISMYSRNALEGFYMVHVDLFSDLNTNKGIFEDSARNPFRFWSKLILNYNTGDFHAGDGDFSYTAQDGSREVLHHHGFRNYRAALDIVKKYAPAPEQLLISGCSGGGFAVALVSDDLIGQFPDCRDVTCLVDSGFFLMESWHDVARDVWHSPDKITERLHSDNITLDALVALYEKYEDKVRYLFTCSVRDSALSRMVNYFETGKFDFSRASGDLFRQQLQVMCNQLQERLPGIGLYIFDIPDKSQMDSDLTIHCIIGEKTVYEHTTDGKSAMEWIRNAVNGKVEQIGLSLFDLKE